jgi:hypothetical protein
MALLLEAPCTTPLRVGNIPEDHARAAAEEATNANWPRSTGR